MKLTPVGAASLLVARQFNLLHTPRLLRLGLARSVLAERLRRSVGYRPHCALLCRQALRVPVNPAPTQDPPDAVDRDWPSDFPAEPERHSVEVVVATRIQSVLGGKLDVWS